MTNETREFRRPALRTSDVEKSATDKERGCPLLLVNGEDDLHDRRNAWADLYLALEHGPKTARMFPGGPMGEGPVLPTVLDWITGRLS
ncbi:hypothetical protein ACFVJH_23280 [Streptomyces decoyicus]|uniref:hypothetical protein n=1 Tax=Streptomyces decoyicus TaxID=249567 RepID=UPI00363038CC